MILKKFKIQKMKDIKKDSLEDLRSIIKGVKDGNLSITKKPVKPIIKLYKISVTIPEETLRKLLAIDAIIGLGENELLQIYAQKYYESLGQPIELLRSYNEKPIKELLEKSDIELLYEFETNYN
jgi:hypothetical protein